jgi:hypothetical protein
MGYAFQPNETILSMEECVPQQGENAIYHPVSRHTVYKCC